MRTNTNVARVTHLQDVIGWREHKRRAAERERDVGQRRCAVAAREHGRASAGRNGAEREIEVEHSLRRTGNERRARVADRLGALREVRLARRGHVGDRVFPVGFARQRDPGELARVARRISAAECHLRVARAGRVREEEREHRRRHELLRHDVVPDRRHAVDADRVKRQAENAVEHRNHKRETGLGGRLAKDLILHLEAANRQHVLRQEAAARARAVLDRERRAVGDVRLRRRRVVLVVQIARNVRPRAFLRLRTFSSALTVSSYRCSN